jgi:hypothetical protein
VPRVRQPGAGAQSGIHESDAWPDSWLCLVEETSRLIPSHPGCGNARSSVRLASGYLRRDSHPLVGGFGAYTSRLVHGGANLVQHCWLAVSLVPTQRFGLPGMWQKRSVYKVHTFGFGLGRTSTGLVRIGYVSAGLQSLQGLECSSSSTSGTCFPCSGAYGPLDVYKSPL